MSRSRERRLLDDCFLTDRDRVRHDDVVAMIRERLTIIAPTETIGLAEAQGRYLATPVTAPRDVPLADNAAVDGYAFAYADYFRRNTLGVRGRVAAGDLGSIELVRGEAARIFTGAVMPLGADTVAMQEDCDVSDDGRTVTVPKGLKPGANRRRAGEDLEAGQPVLEQGDALRPQEIAALASLGVGQLEVYRPLRIALVSTGNELVEPGTANDLVPGQVFDSNRAMLRALTASLPVTVTDLGILTDDSATIEETLREAAASHDLILSTGGASRGEEDHIVEILDRIGKRHLWQIAVKPGRPMTFGQISDDAHDCVFLGLPGNPVAVFVCFLLYVRPVLQRLGGRADETIARYPLPANFEIARKKPGRREFLRGWLGTGEDGRPAVEKFASDGSGLITGLRQATGLIELPEDTERVARGDTVLFIPFSTFGIAQ
ncbi:molybdopterin molybdotransferase MoeA [Pararhizobium haloflavum]|uniref:molybdopterin molybdotransferase MoeA n=1 Tax=Pararhizobium haloflavum TaxID=2037914 RepID=UPI000C18F654|nr:gephyrin-like molybdotransferase Glp [Pararhizobium haloflavum]